MIFPDTVRQKATRLSLVAAAAGLAVAFGGAPAHAAVATQPNKTPTFNGTVWATAYAGNTLYVGGDFTTATVGGTSYARSRLAAVDATTGALLPWAPAADGQIRGIAASGNAVYVAGAFGKINNQRRDSLARVDGTSGAVHATFKHTIYGQPLALGAANGRLYVGGTITNVNGQPRSALAAFDLTNGALDAGWKPSADDKVEALVATGGRVYVGGRFHKVNGVSGTLRMAAVNPTNGSVDMTFRPDAKVVVHSLALGPDAVYAAQGGQGGRVVAYGLNGAKRWELTTDGDAQAVAVLDNVVYLGGHFDHVCRSARTGDRGVCIDGSERRVKLAAASAGGDLLDWTANGNGVDGVHALAASGGLHRVAAGGSFTTINGASQKRLAQFGP